MLSHTSFTGGDRSAERAADGQYDHAYGVMAYPTAETAGLDWRTTSSATPIRADVAALRKIYGADVATRTGDTVYGFDATADRAASDFDRALADHGAVAAITTGDAGGTGDADAEGPVAAVALDGETGAGVDIVGEAVVAVSAAASGAVETVILQNDVLRGWERGGQVHGHRRRAGGGRERRSDRRPSPPLRPAHGSRRRPGASGSVRSRGRAGGRFTERTLARGAPAAMPALAALGRAPRLTGAAAAR